MKSVHALVAMMVAAVPCAASAADLSHNYVEAGVARLSEDLPASIGGDARFDGGYLRGSVALGTAGLYGFGIIAGAAVMRCSMEWTSRAHRSVSVTPTG